MSDEYPLHNCYEHDRVVIRATDRKQIWGDLQVLECRYCGRRWSE